MRRRAALLLLALSPAAPLSSQANTDGAIDLLLAQINDLTVLGRQGAFPNGINGCTMETTACNGGTKEISWQQAMDPDHPFIAFLLARESNGRFEQVSDRSYVKHGFFALSASFCSACTPTDGTKLGLGVGLFARVGVRQTRSLRPARLDEVHTAVDVDPHQLA